MGTWLHRLSNIDAGARRAICAFCGPISIRRSNRNAGHGWRCNGRRRMNPSERGYAGGRWAYQHHRGDHCSRCGFVPEHVVQLDVNHKDGNHQNNDPSNLETLCANCHRLVTWQMRWAIPAID